LWDEPWTRRSDYESIDQFEDEGGGALATQQYRLLSAAKADVQLRTSQARAGDPNGLCHLLLSVKKVVEQLCP